MPYIISHPVLSYLFKYVLRRRQIVLLDDHFIFFQWLISGETLKAGSTPALLCGFVVCAISVPISFSQFCH